MAGSELTLRAFAPPSQLRTEAHRVIVIERWLVGGLTAGRNK